MTTQRTRPTARRRTRRIIATVAVLLMLTVSSTIIIDVLAFDRTTGGTPPDYQDFEGAPIDWDSYDLTETGFVGRGYLLDAHLDCTSGMLSFEALGVSRDYRPLSERALHVHQPREACIRHGFTPEF